ncbi:hypothetical protein FRC04_011095 [Tulasnella sp. 424]|nr:hypothetical protein FRC04_011095 [Tulasnella sp. 424]
MSAIKHSILVVGGNGFLGSAVCRRALAKGLDVTSISSSGQPFRTPKGHVPGWTSKVKWHTASALEPSSYASLLDGKTAVVHTLGVLLEGGYKNSLKEGDIFSLGSSFVRNFGLESGNPLTRDKPGEYEVINRDSALRVFETYKAAAPQEDAGKTFVYVSAEDVFRPFVPKRYIDSKRHAEEEISRHCGEISPAAPIRDVFIRPGLMYHPHLRPLTTPLAVLLDISSRLHHKPPLGLYGMLPSSILRSIASRPQGGSNFTSPQSVSSTTPAASAGDPSSLESLANLLEVPPIHVDQVADAIVEVIRNRPDVRGPVGVEAMRNIIGWRREGEEGPRYTKEQPATL